jgi:hypothetical protein
MTQFPSDVVTFLFAYHDETYRGYILHCDFGGEQVIQRLGAQLYVSFLQCPFYYIAFLQYATHVQCACGPKQRKKKILSCQLFMYESCRLTRIGSIYVTSLTIAILTTF